MFIRHSIFNLVKPKNPTLAAVMSDSRRGSLAPSRDGSRRGSRQDSICLAGVERRGSYYGEDVSKRSTVAVVVNDPAAKANMSKALEGVFDQGKIHTLLLFVLNLYCLK